MRPTGADQTLGPRPVTLSSEGRPLLAVSAVFVAGSGGVARKFLVRASVHMSWVLVEAGGRNCRTPPRACSVGNAILTIR